MTRALQLYFTDELSLAELSAELGLSQRDGRAALAVGMQRLDRFLEGDDDGTLGVV